MVLVGASHIGLDSSSFRRISWRQSLLERGDVMLTRRLCGVNLGSVCGLKVGRQS